MQSRPSKKRDVLAVLRAAGRTAVVSQLVPPK